MIQSAVSVSPVGHVNNVNHVNVVNPVNLGMPPLARAVRSFESAQRCAPGKWQFGWHFAADDTAFAGHFPDQPILPGVFLLEMAQRASECALRESLGGSWRVNRVQRMRFIAPVKPGDYCVLQVTWDGEAGAADNAISLSISFSKGDAPLARGSLHAVRAGSGAQA